MLTCLIWVCSPLALMALQREAGRILVQLYSPAAALFIRTLDALCTALQGSARLTGGTKTTVHIVPDDKYIQEAIVLNANTGLIGMPQQTMGAGVNVRCLINPNIKLGAYQAGSGFCISSGSR